MNIIDLATSIATLRVSSGEVALFWLGQAGFLLKNSQGGRFVIDPYLTACGERIKGFKRLSPQMLAPHELGADLYLTTHHHFDHYDYDAVPIAAGNPATVFCGPKTCAGLMLEAGIPKNRVRELAPGDATGHRGLCVTATRADHGDMAPDAIGALLETDGIRFYFSGDTAYRPDYLAEVAAGKPDVALLTINGEYGNMDAREGALAAGLLGVSVAVPCHFWTFAEHRGDPLAFQEQLAGSGCKPVLMQQGEALVFRRDKLGRGVLHESGSLYRA